MKSRFKVTTLQGSYSSDMRTRQASAKEAGTLSAQHIRAQLDLYEQFEVVQVTPAVIRAGLDLHQTRRVAFYDALIMASAQLAGCSVLFSEDMNAGETMAGVRIINPFA